MEAYVTTDISSEGIATITFFHPSQNSLPSHILSLLAETITHTSNNPLTKIIILQSGGERTFCAGASFDELASIQTPEEGTQFFSGFAKVINACRTSPILILGRVQGKAVGGGVGVAAATDYCFATQHASIRLSELLIGIGPFVVGPAIERKIGIAAFTELTLHPSIFYSASWAKEKGLFAEVYDDIPALDEGIRNFAYQLIQYNPEALKALKKVFWEATEHWDSLLKQRAAMSGTLVLSSHTQKAIANFKK